MRLRLTPPSHRKQKTQRWNKNAERWESLLNVLLSGFTRTNLNYQLLCHLHLILCRLDQKQMHQESLRKGNCLAWLRNRLLLKHQHISIKLTLLIFIFITLGVSRNPPIP